MAAREAAFVAQARARVTSFLKTYDDIESLAREYVALGGNTFVSGNDWTQSDITQADFVAALIALNGIRTTVATGTNARDLYKAKS